MRIRILTAVAALAAAVPLCAAAQPPVAYQRNVTQDDGSVVQTLSGRDGGDAASGDCGEHRRGRGSGAGHVRLRRVDDGSFPLKVGCVYNNSIMGFTSTWKVNLQCSNGGFLGIAMAGSTSPVNVASATSQAGNGSGNATVAVEEGGTTFSEITTATSTTVKAAGGILHSLCVNTFVAAATIKVYNATSATGTPITITLPSTITGVDPFCLKYDAYFGTGIFVVTSAATDVTVTYR